MPSHRCRSFRHLLVVMLFTVVIMWAAAGSVMAHAIVTWSSLQATPVLEQTPTTIRLRFNARIEWPFTQVSLVSADDEVRPLRFAAGARPGEMAVQLPALPPGVYGLRYEVLAADGHFTRDTLRFRVPGPR